MCHEKCVITWRVAARTLSPVTATGGSAGGNCENTKNAAANRFEPSGWPGNRRVEGGPGFPPSGLLPEKKHGNLVFLNSYFSLGSNTTNPKRRRPETTSIPEKRESYTTARTTYVTCGSNTPALVYQQVFTKRPGETSQPRTRQKQPTPCILTVQEKIPGNPGEEKEDSKEPGLRYHDRKRRHS